MAVTDTRKLKSDTSILKLEEMGETLDTLTKTVVLMHGVSPVGVPEIYVGYLKQVVVEVRQREEPGIDTPQAAKVATPADTKVTEVRGTQFNSNKSAANTTSPEIPSSNPDATSPGFSGPR